MSGPEPWASDPNVADRQPAHCPYCDSEGAFDSVSVRQNQTTSNETHYRHHCPECGYEFITINPDPDQ